MDAQLRKEVLRKISYGLYVVTAHQDTGWVAATVNWLSQCSFTPPLVMIGVKKDSGLHAALMAGARAAVHVLAAGQQQIAADFFRPTEHHEGKLNGHPFQLHALGVPVLTEIPWYFIIEPRDWIHRGDHSVLVAEVVEVGKNAEAERPLVMAETPWSYGG